MKTSIKPIKPIKTGNEVRIVKTNFASVSKGTIGTIEATRPDMGGYEVKVKTHNVALFGGGSISGGGVYFFQPDEIEEVGGGQETQGGS